MNATVAPLEPARRQRTDDTNYVTALRAALRSEFLVEAGWDSDDELLAPSRQHPLLGMRECVVVDCTAPAISAGLELCQLCAPRYAKAGLPLEEFAQVRSGKRNKGEQLCRVSGCERPSHARPGLCFNHHVQRKKKYQHLSVEDYLALPGLVPFPSFGPCRVASCIRRAVNGRLLLCTPHRSHWRAHQRENPETTLEIWASVAGPINTDHYAILKGLPEQVQLELLVGLQARTDAGVKTSLAVLRCVINNLRAHGSASLEDLDPSVIKRVRRDTTALLRSLCQGVRRTLTTPEAERLEDVWDLTVFGLRGRLDFTGISQHWLRETTKRWAEHDLPLHRGRQGGNTAKIVVAVVRELSDALRLGRDDHGEDPTKLGRGDIMAVTNRLAHKERVGTLTPYMRVVLCRHLRRFLADIRPLGLTRPGGPAAALPDDVVLIRTDIPAEPDPDDTGRALPEWAIKVVNDNLFVLEQRSGIDSRRLVELLIDTGRRPDELCRLAYNCLARDSSDKPVLVYTDFKNNRPGRRLPIAEATAKIILDQQAHVRALFPDTPLKNLALFPRDYTNPAGTEPTEERSLSDAHRKFIDAIAHLLTRELVGNNGQVRREKLDRSAVVAYAYRHSYAQRHADQGVPPDVLRDLMGHKSMQTTLTYYRVTEKRTREAVDRVSAHQFDGSGNRVFRGITQLLAHEHARIRVGQVAVPFGICTEPSNVKAGGQACPYKFTCLGCGHFRSDPSYLPELKSYLQQMLADRERLRAADDLEEWARSKISPRDEEIAKLRALIRRIEADLDQLSDEDRAQISDAVSVIRKTRQVVNLGMPTSAPPSSTDAG